MSPRVTVLVMTDGRRDCITRAIASMGWLDGDISGRYIHDDSGDDGYRLWLARQFPSWTIYSTGRRSGFDQAMRSAWQLIRDADDAPFLLHTEDDFVFTRAWDLALTATVIDEHRHLAQLALRRQPWNADERAAGGIVEQHPDDYTDRTNGWSAWLEHRRFFTTNPSLIRRDFVLDHQWPTGPNSEGRFGVDLFAAEPATRSGFWGSRDSGVWVEHIGTQRVGTGY